MLPCCCHMKPGSKLYPLAQLSTNHRNGVDHDSSVGPSHVLWSQGPFLILYVGPIRLRSGASPIWVWPNIGYHNVFPLDYPLVN